MPWVYLTQMENRPPRFLRARRPERVIGSRRSAILSLLDSQTESIVPPPRNPLVLWSKAAGPWILNYLKVALSPRRRFKTYAALDYEKPGIYLVPNECNIALVSDWGSGTLSAYNVRDCILAQDPDVTIHLGDVYYSGTEREFGDYFLGNDDWPRGKLNSKDGATALPSYLLNGNHEMYSGGVGYFDFALPLLNQETSYFCLENRHWRIVGIDTGYYAKSIPLLELLPYFIRLHRANRRWLRRVVFSDGNDKRPVILLSHHQWFSSFEKEYRRFGRQLRPSLDRILLWFWGHEHRFAGYAPFGFGSSKIRARCIGHGGMPVEIEGKVKRPERPLVFVDERQSYSLEGRPIGYCGFALLRLKGSVLEIEYIDEWGTKLLAEQWQIKDGHPVGSVKGGKELSKYRPLEQLVL